MAGRFPQLAARDLLHHSLMVRLGNRNSHRGPWLRSVAGYSPPGSGGRLSLAGLDPALRSASAARKPEPTCGDDAALHLGRSATNGGGDGAEIAANKRPFRRTSQKIAAQPQAVHCRLHTIRWGGLGVETASPTRPRRTEVWPCACVGLISGTQTATIFGLDAGALSDLPTDRYCSTRALQPAARLRAP